MLYFFFTEFSKCQKRTYYFSDIALDWVQSNLMCKTFGMELLTLNTEAEYVMFNDLARKSKPVSLHYYMGGLRTKNNVWYWMDTGDQIKTMKWHPGEPNFDLNIHICLTFFNDPDMQNATMNNISCRTQEYPLKFACQMTEKLC